MLSAMKSCTIAKLTMADHLLYSFYIRASKPDGFDPLQDV
jgi:hypothetical protein